MTQTVNYASPADASRHGEYTFHRGTRPLYRFASRIGSSTFAAEPGRYHLYAGWWCPWSQRAAIQRLLNGLDDVVSVSYVDGRRDGRGWAFREATGADPVNGFTLLREAYEATEPGFDGLVSVPVLWDRHARRIVSNDFATISVDLATAFREFATPTVDTYPAGLSDEIEKVDRWLGPAVNHGIGRAAKDEDAARRLIAAFRDLDARLRERRYLLGSSLTEADVRLWVTLVRYDAGANAHGTIGPRLSTFPHLWAYARDLYQQPAFQSTTNFASFAAPLADPGNWSAPAHRVED